MGGAERSARKRRQTSTGAKAVAAARTGKSDRTKVILTVVAVVVLAVAVIGGVIYTNNQKNATEGVAIQPKPAPTEALPARRDGAAVVVGQDTAKVKLDVYEDFLCPACGQLEARDGASIQEQVRAGNVQIRYHMLPMLADRSDPPGYSLDSANASLCAADAGKFPEFHSSLYSSQPEEGARGYDKAQLTKLGQDLGITTPQFGQCVASGQYNQQLEDAFQKARTTPYLLQESNGQQAFGTPTIALGEKTIDPSDPQWLTNLVNAP